MVSNPSTADAVDLVVIGGGIAGSSLATVMARAGRSVLVLEKSRQYQDRVRGETWVPWGAAEADRLGLANTLLAAGGHHSDRMALGEERLDEHGETAVLRGRHATYYANLATTLREQFLGPGQIEAGLRLAAEQENILRDLETAVQRPGRRGGTGRNRRA
jgi:2-polyprenyl-6-methoxyphenol hydroxylase-like FAD-dependent oxidoreductase